MSNMSDRHPRCTERLHCPCWRDGAREEGEMHRRLREVADAAWKMRDARERKAMAGPDLTAAIVAEQRLYQTLDAILR